MKIFHSDDLKPIDHLALALIEATYCAVMKLKASDYDESLAAHDMIYYMYIRGLEVPAPIYVEEFTMKGE